MLDWIKKEINTEFKVGLNNLKVSTILIPVHLITQVVAYFIFKDSLYQNGFWVIMIPALADLVVALIYLIPKRNNPNYQIYYLFHLSTVSKIAILMCVVFVVIFYFIVSCNSSLKFISYSSCLKDVLHIR